MTRKALLPVKLTAILLMASACSDGGASRVAPITENAAAESPALASANSTSTTSAAAANSPQDSKATATAIKHLVVIFSENRSFDHYFGVYPNATNPSGEPAFTAAAATPSANNYTATPSLLTANANSTQPFRLDRAQANTSSQNHNYTPEQLAEDNGKMDLFPQNTGTATNGGAGAFGTTGQVMGYFDGNTVTAMWNYAQNFALSDNTFTDSFGPSTPGAINVISGTTNGAKAIVGTASTVPDGQGGATLINDTDPAADTCSSTTSTVLMTSKNIGDLLNAAEVTWGGFMGGFNLQTVNSNNTTGCNRSTFSSVLNASSKDYVAHHAWFQYYASTRNPAHTRPTSTALIGYTDPLDSTATPVHHQYDYNDFVTAVSAGNFPSVSYIKAPSVNDAHPGNSDPLDEQAFVVNLVNFLEQQPDWKNTAVIITYDDSDGWYDHQFGGVANSSFDAVTKESIKSGSGTATGADQLASTGVCNGTNANGQPAKPGVGVNGGAVNGRCGPGTRIPFILISPWAKVNYIDHTRLTQASVIRFIEDNWLGGKRLGQGSDDAATGSIAALFNFQGGGDAPTLFLDPSQGTPVASAPSAHAV